MSVNKWSRIRNVDEQDKKDLEVYESIIEREKVNALRKRNAFKKGQFYFRGDYPYNQKINGDGHNGNEYTARQWNPKSKTRTNQGKVTITTKQHDIKLSDLELNALVVAVDAVDLLIKKHQDYGPKNISDAPGGPINGLAVRLHDKVARLSNLTSYNKKPTNESLEDTLVDILNYALIGLLVLKGKWDK